MLDGQTPQGASMFQKDCNSSKTLDKNIRGQKLHFEGGASVTVKKQPLSALFLFLRLTVWMELQKNFSRNLQKKLFQINCFCLTGGAHSPVSSDPRHTAKMCILTFFKDSDGDPRKGQNVESSPPSSTSPVLPHDAAPELVSHSAAGTRWCRSLWSWSDWELEDPVESWSTTSRQMSQGSTGARERGTRDTGS